MWISLSKSDNLLGNLKFDTVLNQILLCVKKYVFCSKMERAVPTLIGLNKSLVILREKVRSFTSYFLYFLEP